MSSSSSSDTSSRRFTWLMKSCFPNTTTTTPHPHPTPLPTSPTPTTSLSSLPDDLLLQILSTLPLSTLPSLPSVCRKWAHLINSPSFSLLRRRHNLLSHTLFSISISNSTTLSTATLKLNQNPNPHRIHDQDPVFNWKVSSFVLGNGSAAFALFANFRLVSIGRKVYVIGKEAMLRCDTWTGTLVPKEGMRFRRKKFAAAAVKGRIYVAGGCARSAAVEEFDPEGNVWRVVGDAPRRRYGCVGAAVDGVFYVVGGLKIGNGGGNESRATAAEPAHVYASSMDLYDVEARVWLRSRVVPGGGCVVAACAANDNIYILTSHAVELSFWKFDASRKSSTFGEWCRIKSPPLPAQVRLDSSVRFSCVGVGDKVVLIQVVGCIDDLLRRSGRTERGLKEGLVLVYDSGGGEWSRVADMPEVMRRAACVCVEC